MTTKLDDSIEDEKSRRKRRGNLRNRLEVKLGKHKNEYKKFINGVREKVAKERDKIKNDNNKKIRAIRIENKQAGAEQCQAHFQLS